MSTTVKAPSLPDVKLTLPGVTATLSLSARTFSTGSTGYNGFGKVASPDGKRYQVNINVVLIGSKPSA